MSSYASPSGARRPSQRQETSCRSWPSADPMNLGGQSSRSTDSFNYSMPAKKTPTPLDAHAIAIETLMYLAENGRTQEIRLDAARELVGSTAAWPTSEWKDDDD